MKTLLRITIALMIAALFGCATDEGLDVPAEEDFSLTAPTLPTTIKQGDTQTVTVSLQRERFFKQDVTLDVKVGDGIDVDPDRVKVEAGDLPDVPLQVKVSRDAPIGDYQVRVTATPDKGALESEDFTVKVVAP